MIWERNNAVENDLYVFFKIVLAIALFKEQLTSHDNLVRKLEDKINKAFPNLNDEGEAYRKFDYDSEPLYAKRKLGELICQFQLMLPVEDRNRLNSFLNDLKWECLELS